MSIDGVPPSKAAPSNRAIFLAALKLGDEHRRRAFLDHACGGDARRREEIERLLTACHAGTPNPLDQAVAQLGPAKTRATDAVGSLKFDVSSHPTIDRYKLLEQIGEGGMGAVFMAQQNEPIRRKVALKLIEPGMDSREVIPRFQAERQALAMMKRDRALRAIEPTPAAAIIPETP